MTLNINEDKFRDNCLAFIICIILLYYSNIGADIINVNKINF